MVDLLHDTSKIPSSSFYHLGDYQLQFLINILSVMIFMDQIMHCNTCYSVGNVDIT